MTTRIPNNARVKLRDGIGPEFYNGFGLAGNEGWIRKHDDEGFGIIRVYIEWDKDHWAYNGAPDKWTWEEHFDIVEDAMSDKNNSKQEQLNTLLGAFGDSLLEIFGEGEASDPEIPEAPNSLEEIEEPSYEDILKAAFTATVDAEAFFVIAMRKNDEERSIFPLVYHASRTPSASLIAQLQLSHVAANFHGKIIGEALQQGAGESK